MSTAHPPTTHDRHHGRRLTLTVWRNPLARSTDRAEAALGTLVIGIWLLALPVVAAAGSLWWPEASAAAALQQRTYTNTSAVLTADATEFVFSEHGTPISGQVPVTARWIAPDGSERSGTINTTGGARSGETVRIWVDPSGNPTAPPMSSTAAASLVILEVVGSWLTLGAVLGAMWFAVRLRLNRSRFAGWGNDWQRIEPLWSGRNH